MVAHIGKVKSKDRFMEAVKSLYREYGVMERRIPNFDLVRRYVNAEQSTLKYRKLLSIDEMDGQSHSTINWRPVAVLGPVQRIAAARVMRKEEHVVAVPVDARAQDEANDFFSKMKARLLLKKALVEEGADVDSMPRLDGEPETIEELEVMVRSGLKHRLAKDYEDAVEAVAKYSGLDDQREEAISQLFHYGYAAWKHYVDDRGLLRVRLVPAGKLIAPRTIHLDWRDAPAIGEEMELTVAQVIELYPGITPREERMLRGATSHSTRDDKVRVVYMEIKGSEMLAFERRYTSYGAEIVRYRKGKGSGDAISMDKVYGGYWVVDTDICFGFGEVPYTPRQVATFDKARFTYSARAVTLVNGIPKGLAVDAIPHVDAFHLAWYKMQQTIATLRPNAIFIAVESLIGVPIKDKDKPVTASQLLELFAEKNVLVGRIRDETGRASGVPPVSPINTGAERQFVQLRQAMVDAYDQVRRLYGLNAMTDASTPNADTLTTVARLAEQGTSNALYVVERADRMLMTSLYQGVADRIAVMMARGAPAMRQFLERVIGRSSVLVIRNSQPFYMYDVGITIRDAPNVEERQGLEEAMQRAVAEGLITPSDIAFVRSIPDPSQAAEILDMRILRNRRRSEEQSLRLQQMNAQVQMESAQVAHQLKMQELKMEAEMEIYVWQNTKAKELEMEAALKAGKLEIEAAKAKKDLEPQNVET